MRITRLSGLYNSGGIKILTQEADSPKRWREISLYTLYSEHHMLPRVIKEVGIYRRIAEIALKNASRLSKSSRDLGILVKLFIDFAEHVLKRSGHYSLMERSFYQSRANINWTYMDNHPNKPSLYTLRI